MVPAESRIIRVPAENRVVPVPWEDRGATAVTTLFVIGAPMTAAAAMPAGAVSVGVTLDGQPMTGVLTMPAGDASMSVIVDGQPMTADVIAWAGDLATGVTLTGQPMTADTLDADGTVEIPATIDGAPMTATVTVAPEGAVEIVNDIILNGDGPQTVTAEMPAGGTVTTGVGVTGLTAAVAATMPVGAISHGVTLTGAPMTATATAPVGDVVAIAFARQRIVKSGTWSAPFSTDTTVTGWVADATYPGAVDSDGLRVDGAAAVTVTAVVDVTTGWNSPTITLRRNGTAIATDTTAPQQTTSTRTLTWSGTVADDDLITVTYYASAQFHAVTGGYIDIAPA